MIRRDMDEVLEIERCGDEHPWNEDELVKCLKHRNSIGMVASYGDEIVGFMVYDLATGELRILKMTVAADHRRCRIGTQMIGKLVAKLSQQKRNAIIATVRETNRAAQEFLKYNLFIATHVVRSHYDDTGEDAYRFVYDRQRMCD